MSDTISEPMCSFCFKPKSEVAVLVKAPVKLVYICDQCVAGAKKMLDEPEEDDSDGVA